MNKKIFTIAVLVAVIAAFSSCTSINKTLKEPNNKVNFYKSDFTLSDQVTADAQSTKILCIDWSRLFLSKTGTLDGAGGISMASIPIIGSFVADKTANYALYTLMTKNPGYDVVFYPQYETKVFKPVLGIGFILKTTTVKVTARLGKL
jgi:hypothetical protein